MERSVPRIGAWAGWIAVAGITGYHLALMLLAGTRVSGTDDVAAIEAFYGQPIVAVLGVSQFLVVIPFLVFALALRATLGSTPMRAFLAGIALVAGIAQAPAILTEIAAQAALVRAVEAGDSVAGLFRFWDTLYNSGVYGLEATWVIGFGLAMRGASGFPRFMSWLSPLAALLLFVNVFAIWVGIPDAATLPSAAAITVWMAGAAVGLRRQADVPAATLVPAPAV